MTEQFSFNPKSLTMQRCIKNINIEGSLNIIESSDSHTKICRTNTIEDFKSQYGSALRIFTLKYYYRWNTSQSKTNCSGIIVDYLMSVGCYYD